MGYVDYDEQGGATPTTNALFNTLKALVVEKSVNANNNDIAGKNHNSSQYFTTDNFAISDVTPDHFTISGVAPNFAGSKTIYYTLRKDITKAGANFTGATITDFIYMDDTHANTAQNRKQFFIDKFNSFNALEDNLKASDGFKNYPNNTPGISGGNIIAGKNRNHYANDVAGDIAFNISESDIIKETKE
jgi:hypothetical protein